METLINQLYSYVEQLANSHHASSFFAGEEPASDEDNRYFTNEEFGSLGFH